MRKALVLGGLLVALAAGGYYAATKLEARTDKFNCGDGQLLVTFGYNYLGDLLNCHACVNGNCEARTITVDECTQIRDMLNLAMQIGICVQE